MARLRRIDDYEESPMKSKISLILIIMGGILFIVCGANFLFEFLPQNTVPVTGVIALVCVGSGAHIGRSGTK